MLQRLQPCPRYSTLGAGMPSETANSTSSVFGATATLQPSHVLRTRRWATIAITDDAIKKPSMPMSVNRSNAPTASVAWSEDSTRWPVSADWTAISAVSRSRISPTRMMSGSWRRMARRPLAKLMSASLLIWLWLMLSNMYSTGSSIVMMLRTCWSSSWIEAYSVVVLPLPVGPDTIIIPYGECSIVWNRPYASLENPSLRSAISE